MKIKIKNVTEKYLARKKDLKLMTRYYDIFEYRHGITDGTIHSLQKTGEKFGISGTRVRQIEARVLFEIEK